MEKDISDMIPVLTTPAGCSLTASNWREAGVRCASFHLSALLMKPGEALLSTLADLAHYVGWQAKTVLNASLPVQGEGYALRSSYDGRRMTYSPLLIATLLTNLKADIVVLPELPKGEAKTVWSNLPASVIPFVPMKDWNAGVMAERVPGVYFSYAKETAFETLLECLKPYRANARYVAGEFSMPQLLALRQEGVTFIESDKPANDAYLGKMYNHEGEIVIQDTTYAMDFKKIDEQCTCPTCAQSFTRAYLHHLLLHTPLLCQRLLIQHNTYFCQMA